MSFQDFINQGWNDHADDAAAVADRLPQGVELMVSPADLPGLAGLALHVFGEHLGRWQDGVTFFETLTDHPFTAQQVENQRAVHRCLATLRLAGDMDGVEDAITKANDDQWPEESTKVRIYAGAAAALSGQGETDRSSALLKQSLEFVAYEMKKADPAARTLAMTGNNMAAALEEKENRTSGETALMIEAAVLGRKYWAVTGTWVEVERAEYRLAMSLFSAGKFEKSLHHADKCLEICKRQQAGLFEQFFGHEARTKALRGLGRVEEAAKALAEAKAAVSNVEWSLGYMKDVLAKLEA